jgi:cell division protein FtsB
MNIKEKWNKIPPVFKNRFFLMPLIFFIWVAFFDQNDLITQYKFKKELNKLTENRDYYLEEIEKTKQDLEELMTNNEKLEKFAREKYLMKKNNEDIFVIVPEKK